MDIIKVEQNKNPLNVKDFMDNRCILFLPIEGYNALVIGIMTIDCKNHQEFIFKN